MSHLLLFQNLTTTGSWMQDWVEFFKQKKYYLFVCVLGKFKLWRMWILMDFKWYNVLVFWHICRIYILRTLNEQKKILRFFTKATC